MNANAETRRTRWMRPVILGVRAQVYAFVSAMAVTAGYATVLAVRARGTPNQALINAFAGRVSPWVTAVVGLVMTFLLGRRLAKERGGRPIAPALLMGATSAAIFIIPPLVLRGTPSIRALAIVACLVLAGVAGGAQSQRAPK